MRHRFVLALPLALLVTAHGADAGPKTPPPPPPPGLKWEASLQGARERAEREGRPLLVCVNALEDQVSTLVTQHYPSEAWGKAARGYVCLVANQGDHKEVNGACPRFAGIPCSSHRDALDWIVRNYADEKGDIISPAHYIFEPDGALAYREDIFDQRSRTGPTLFELVLSVVSPDLAVRIAGIDRETKIAEVAKASAERAGELARTWLAQVDDGYSAAGLLSALMDAEAPAKRHALIAAFAKTPGVLVPALVPTVEGVTSAPDERPDDVVAWVVALLEADRPTGVWAAARAFVRAKQAPLKKRVLLAWTGADDPEGAKLPPGERAALAEALRLVGRTVPHALEVDDTEGTAMVPSARRIRARLKASTGGTPLPQDLAGLAPGALRAALLRAHGDHVGTRKAEVIAVLRGSPHLRVRIAAATALLSVPERADGLVEAALLDGLFDAVEGSETRALLAAKTGDLGDEREAWAAGLAQLLAGDR